MPSGSSGQATPIVPPDGSATIAAGRASTGSPRPLVTSSEVMPGGVASSPSTTLPTSTTDRSQLPALAVNTWQPSRSAATATGSEPTAIELRPGVSGSASTNDTSIPENADAGWVSNVVIASVPGTDWRK